MNTLTLTTGTVDSYISPTTETHHDNNHRLELSPLMIGVCAAGAGIFLIVIMTVLCLFAQRRRDRHSKLKLKLASSTSSSSCIISDIEHQEPQRGRRLRNGKTISQPFDPRKGEMLIESMPPAAFFDTGSRVTSFISSPPLALAPTQSQSQSSLSPSSTRRQTSRRHRLQPPIASTTNVGVPVATMAQQPPKHQLSRAATGSSFVPSFVSPTTPTTIAAVDWQHAAPSSDLNHTRSPTSYLQSPTLTSPDSIPIRLDLVHSSTNVGRSGDTGRSAGGSSVTLHATHADDDNGQSVPSSPVTARRPEEKVADLVAALERNEVVSVVKRRVPPTF